MRQGHKAALTHRDTSLTRPPKWAEAGVSGEVDTEAGMLSGISRERSIRSNPYWFTEFCNSQCSSHFAAPFIVVRAETSVAESCNANMSCGQPLWVICGNKRTEFEDTHGSRHKKGRRSDQGPLPSSICAGVSMLSPSPRRPSRKFVHNEASGCVRMILPQVHLRKPCYDFSFL